MGRSSWIRQVRRRNLRCNTGCSIVARHLLTTAKVRHASSHFAPIDVPIRRTCFFIDFDPSEGESTERLKVGDAVQVIEVRRGSVLGYLTEGDYTGEGCFLDDCSGSVYRYTSNVTAMEDSSLCFLQKDDLVRVKHEFPGTSTTQFQLFNGFLGAKQSSTEAFAEQRSKLQYRPCPISASPPKAPGASSRLQPKETESSTPRR